VPRDWSLSVSASTGMRDIMDEEMLFSRPKHKHSSFVLKLFAYERTAAEAGLAVDDRRCSIEENSEPPYVS
jgi:hypothetical protein